MMNKAIFIFVLMMISCSVNLPLCTMDVSRREKVLEKSAIKAINHHYPEYHREYADFKIENYIVDGGEHKAKKVFKVFLFHKEKDSKEFDYDIVRFWDDTGKPFSIYFGETLMGYRIE